MTTEERRKSRKKELCNSYPAAKKSVVLCTNEDIKVYVKLLVGESSGKRPSEGTVILQLTLRSVPCEKIWHLLHCLKLG
jgi:hypothetical protein